MILIIQAIIHGGVYLSQAAGASEQLHELVHRRILRGVLLQQLLEVVSGGLVLVLPEHHIL
jgi:hypothetical protein